MGLTVSARVRRQLVACGALAVVVLASAPAASAQDSLRISVVTMGPGEQVWERFGHNAIMVEDFTTGDARWYNYGMFSFASEDFWPRFLRGQMRYWMAGHDADWELRNYVAANRSVRVQELDLDSSQRRAMRDFLLWNAQPENKYYEYDYFRDNCSTRIRDAVDSIVGGALRAATESLPSGTTYRFHVRRLTAPSLAVYGGVELTMGRPADRPTSRWEEMWLPMALHDHLGAVRLHDSTGATRPLVKREVELFASTLPPPPSLPPTRWPALLVVGGVLGAALVRLGELAPGDRRARVGMQILGAAWSLFAGIAGSVLAFLQLLTEHFAAHANENLFQFSPLSLLLVVLVPLGFATRRRSSRAVTVVALAVAALSIGGVLVKLMPGPSQYNVEAIALALPIHLGLAVAVWRRAARPADST